MSPRLFFPSLSHFPELELCLRKKETSNYMFSVRSEQAEGEERDEGLKKVKCRGKGKKAHTSDSSASNESTRKVVDSSALKIKTHILGSSTQCASYNIFGQSTKNFRDISLPCILDFYLHS